MKFAGCGHTFRKFAIFFLSIIFLLVLHPRASSLYLADTQHYLNPARELDLFKKVLTFERTWKSRTSGQLVIGLIYQGSYRPSAWAAEDWEHIIKNLPESEKQVEGISLAVVPIDLETTPSLENELAEKKINFLYLTPLDDKTSQRIINNLRLICSKLKIGTFTSIPDYLDLGLAFCFNLKETKPQIIINLENSRAQGLSFSSHFLRVASVRGKNV